MAVNDPHTRDWIKVRHSETGGETEIPPKSLDSFRSRGWEPVDEASGKQKTTRSATTTASADADTTSAPDSTATVGELRDWALGEDPDNAEAIAQMTKSEIRSRYGDQ